MNKTPEYNVDMILYRIGGVPSVIEVKVHDLGRKE